MTAEALARLFHETYERLAPSFGYVTRKESAVPWEDVPKQNRDLMVAVAAEVIKRMPAARAEAPDVARLAEALRYQAERICASFGKMTPRNHCETHWSEWPEAAGSCEWRQAARAALAPPAVCESCGHEIRYHADGGCDCEGEGEAGLCPCER